MKILRLALALTIPTLVTACPKDGEEDSYDPGYDDHPTDDPVDARAAAKFFLPTGEPDNTSAPTIEADARGGIHAIYPAYAGGDAYYGYCAPGCDSTSDVEVVRFQTPATVINAMIALDRSGRPQVLLSTAREIYHATCSGDCTQAASWTQSLVLDHGGDREVSGEAFALDPQGRPRFIMHVYKAYLGVGQKPPAAFYVHCDADCDAAASWTTTKIADQMWRASYLRFDADGVAKLATVATMGASETSSGTATAAYLECAADCDQDDSWKGLGLLPVFESEYEAVRVTPSISMALTRSGAPRIIVLGYQDGKRDLAYFACDADCAGQGWSGSIISDHPKLGVGVDMVLDKNDHPRFVHTLDYNIALATCDEADCAAPDAKWQLEKVEYGGEMDPDKIFLWPNCNVGAWFLHSPSLALTPSGHAVVGYQARDISGGWQNPDHDAPDCVAGTDMTWSRMAVL